MKDVGGEARDPSPEDLESAEQGKRRRRAHEPVGGSISVYVVFWSGCCFDTEKCWGLLADAGWWWAVWSDLQPWTGPGDYISSEPSDQS